VLTDTELDDLIAALATSTDRPRWRPHDPARVGPRTRVIMLRCSDSRAACHQSSCREQLPDLAAALHRHHEYLPLQPTRPDAAHRGPDHQNRSRPNRHLLGLTQNLRYRPEPARGETKSAVTPGPIQVDVPHQSRKFRTSPSFPPNSRSAGQTRTTSTVVRPDSPSHFPGGPRVGSIRRFALPRCGIRSDRQSRLTTKRSDRSLLCNRLSGWRNQGSGFGCGSCLNRS
jgi:hypothetical protein